MKADYLEVLAKIELEDYVAIKKKAYEFYLQFKDQGIDLKLIDDLFKGNLGYVGYEPEAILVSSTMLLPDDQRFVDLYKENGCDLEKVKKHYSIVDSQNLKIKEYEFNHFRLDRLIETGVLCPISPENMIKNGQKK